MDSNPNENDDKKKIPKSKMCRTPRMEKKPAGALLPHIGPFPVSDSAGTSGSPHVGPSSSSGPGPGTSGKP
jgi:hypothetical protein